VIELDETRRELLGMCREMAPDLRARALAVDSAPEEMDAHLDCETLTLLRAAAMPPRYRTGAPENIARYSDDCVARAISHVELARGDAGVLVANTGPGLAGVCVEALGSPEQQDLFYDAVADGRTWAFFGMTEPERGSDAGAMTTRFDSDGADGYLLNGAKRYVGNGSRGAIGVIFGRTGKSPLTIRAAIVRRPTPGYTGTALDMVGLRGARISALTFEDVAIPRENVLGAKLPASRRGLWGASRTFNVVRLQIAAIALGTAFAALDYVREQRPYWHGTELIGAQLEAARALLYDAAFEVDHSPDDRRSPSVAKLHNTALAVRTTRWAATALGPGSMLEHPLLEKWSRDVHAFEFMDGTSNMLRLHTAPDVSPLELVS
jgi:alkylation response protein AidB-like acyl-CoA dehydrogenase